MNPARKIIAAFRQKGASHTSIAELLARHSLSTGKTTVAEFCHAVLGESVRAYKRISRKKKTRLLPCHQIPSRFSRLNSIGSSKITKVTHTLPRATHRANPKAQTTNHMKRLNLILNGKGGVGKSFFAVNLVQYLKDKNIAHVAIDSDNENSTLNRFHPDSRFVDLADRRGLDGIFSALEKSNLVVMDCRAASTELFIDFFAQINLPAVLSALDAAITLVIPVNHESDSVDQAQQLDRRIW